STARQKETAIPVRCIDLDQIVFDRSVEDSVMAETTKLSVGQALDKLRGTDAPKTRITQLDEKIETLDEETRRLRAARRRLERDQRAGRESKK
ncbi:MAG: hypothetical protein WCA05_17995, partial [Pseudolabrys sp.]